ncbi:MAG TPA: LCP family protein, partial [Actinomycetota bacterium]|nr:LCP family protein [Actinomycetota bacterium]
MRDRGKRGQADRYSGMVRSVRTRARKHMRHRWQWVALGIVVVLAALAGGALWLYVDTSNRIQTEVEHVQPPRNEGDPFNVLLVGSDSRAGLTEKEQERLAAEDETPLGEITGERADTLIVAHVDPATDRITMVQFPRDLWVPVVGRGRDRINSALLEGKGALVRTVERLTGLEINRYVQINIAGFRDLVDAIDGVDVCVPDPIPFDPSTGLEIKEPGMVHFDGDRALRFVRSRKVFGTGDLERIQNQQRFLSAAIDKITSIGTLINPGRIRALIRTAGENLRIDDRTSLPDLYRIGQRLKTFDPQLYEAYTVPNLGISESPVIRPDRTAMRVLFDAIAANESPAAADGVPSVAPGDVDVAVLNGTFEDGAARAWAISSARVPSRRASSVA